MIIRPYEPADAAILVRLFRKNVPTAFGENEIAEYADFLPNNTDPYFVAEYNGQVVGACGYYLIQDGQTARICWILTDPDAKGLGIGRALLQHNLDLIRQHPAVQLIECSTSQVAYQFFEKFGFQLQYTKPDVWAPGLDLYFMSMASLPPPTPSCFRRGLGVVNSDAPKSHLLLFVVNQQRHLGFFDQSSYMIRVQQAIEKARFWIQLHHNQIGMRRIELVFG